MDPRATIPASGSAGRDPAFGRAHGRGQSDLGLHADPRCAEERGASRWPLDARILKAHGLAPVPERPTSWQTFLRAHRDAIAAADFFTTEVWTWRGLVK